MKETTFSKFEPTQNMYDLMTTSILYDTSNSSDDADEDTVFINE